VYIVALLKVLITQSSPLRGEVVTPSVFDTLTLADTPLCLLQWPVQGRDSDFGLTNSSKSSTSAQLYKSTELSYRAWAITPSGSDPNP
jgi:hypothetical protein